MSQVGLAAAVRLTRQSVSAIEAGRAVPAVDVALRLAAALDSSVERLFGAQTAEPRLAVEAGSGGTTGRVTLARVGGRWVSQPLSGTAMRVCADGLATRSSAGRVDVEPVRPLREAEENVVVMGCAPALGLLTDRLNSRAGPGHFVWLPRSSAKALDALEKGHTHIAGVHLVDGRSGEPNVPDVRRYVREEPLVLVTLARWEAGLVVAAGNPKRIGGAEDVARREVRFVAREPGSGARRLLERELRRAGVSTKVVGSTPLVAPGHLEVAQLVSIGAADVGVATRDAALAYGLDFIALAEERYDLVLTRPVLEDPRVLRLFDVMTASPMRRELESLGYDIEHSGELVAELSAA